MSPPRRFSPGLIRSLEVLLAVAETGQMRSGAKMLGLTQSAASQHIATLEKHFGSILLDRATRPARLTHAGLRLHRQAQSIINTISDLEMEMRHSNEAQIGLLRVGLQASIATTLTPGLVALLEQQYGVQDLSLYAGQSGDHEHLLRTKRADLAITSNPFLDLDGLERHTLVTESFLLVLPESYDGPDDDLDAIQERLPLVRFSDSTAAGRLIMQHLRRLKFEPDRVIQADRSSMVTSCVAAGMGFSLLTPTLLIDGLVENMALTIRPLPVTGLSRTLTVVARDNELRDLPEQVAIMSKAVLIETVQKYLGKLGVSSLRTDLS